MNDFTNDSGWLIIWEDIKNGGTPLLIFLFLSVLVVFKQQLVKIGSLIFDKITFKVKSFKESYTIDDVKNHPLFKDLEFWLSIGITTLRLNNIKYMPLDISHKEADDYLLAKEEIAKDILTIKFKTIEEYMTKFLKENSIENLDLISIKTYFNAYWLKCEMVQRAKLLEMGIPTAFLQKYFIYEKSTMELLTQTINTYFDDTVFSISIPSRVYLALNAINHYLTDSYNNMVFTVSAINGDLNGCEYKGHVIGVRKNKILQPPHPTFTLQANELLSKIMYEFSANRVSVVKYYKNKSNSLVHSIVYEVCNSGVLPTISTYQNIPSVMESDILNILKNGRVISSDISKFNSVIAGRLSERGSVAVIIIPIFEDTTFSGIILLDYFSIDTYNKIQNIDKMNEKLLNYGNTMSSYIKYPDNFSFEQL